MAHRVLSIVFSLSLFSCAQEPPALIELYAFDCGVLRLGSVADFSISDDETDIRDLAVPCYMVVHEQGTLLWDGGLSSVRAEVDGWQDLGEGYYERLDHTLAEQLADLGRTIDTFDFVAFSHMHYDHVGVANELEGATLLIQEPEYEAAFAEEISIPAFDRSVYEGLADLERVLLQGDHDVFGDGRVRIISAPGHTPGHQVLFVDLENEGPIVLSGDLYHFQLSRELRRVPGFNWDEAKTLESFDLVEALIRDTGAQLWIEHDLAGFRERRLAPDFYN